MAATLVSDLSGLFRNQALKQAALQLGEPENSVMRGFQTAAAAIFGGLATRSSSHAGFIRQMFDLISNPSNDRGVLDNIWGMFSGRTTQESGEGLGGQMLSMLFGGHQSRVVAGISEASGLRPSSAAKLMGIAAPIIMSVLGKRVREDRLDPSGLSNLLESEATEVRSILPSSLMSMVTDTAARARDAVASAASGASATLESAYKSLEAEPSPGRWLWPLSLGLLAAFSLLWFVTRGREAARIAEQAAEQARSAAALAAEQARSAAASVNNFLRLNLPGGAELSVPQNGLESRLVTFIQDRTRAVDTTTWFEFTRLSFETDSSILRPGSQEELNNIASVLKAFPRVNVKVGGYTDNTGNAAANVLLSQQRADTVKRELSALGIAPARLEAEGYGEQHPIADNTTPEGRALNRRTALRVTQK